ncbi:MAG: YkgJ family cysteine cluster protein [Desulfatibacillaceae bacterium]|nr:YkgJ family cysteine cluster protein [Desulfatibacillaceae bacterium]
MSELEPLCARCAKRGKTCCQWSEIYITQGDVNRILLMTGQSGFYEYRTAQNPQYLDQADDPPWREHVFRADGARRVLKRGPGGDCIFLGNKGCLLPLDCRPLVCRLYPFTYHYEGIHEELETGCPRELVESGDMLLKELDMNPEQARKWHQTLYAEICCHNDYDRPDI